MYDPESDEAGKDELGHGHGPRGHDENRDCSEGSQSAEASSAVSSEPALGHTHISHHLLQAPGELTPSCYASWL